MTSVPRRRLVVWLSQVFVRFTKHVPHSLTTRRKRNSARPTIPEPDLEDLEGAGVITDCPFFDFWRLHGRFQFNFNAWEG